MSLYNSDNPETSSPLPLSSCRRTYYRSIRNYREVSRSPNGFPDFLCLDHLYIGARMASLVRLLDRRLKLLGRRGRLSNMCSMSSFLGHGEDYRRTRFDNFNKVGGGRKERKKTTTMSGDPNVPLAPAWTHFKATMHGWSVLPLPSDAVWMAFPLKDGDATLRHVEMAM